MAIRQWVTVIGMLAALHFARLRSFYLSLAILLAGIILSVGLVFFQAPPGFPSGKFITISVGESIGQAAGELKAAHAINSVLLFKVVVRLTPAVHGVQSGTYVFSKPVGILTVARNVTHGVTGIPRSKVTFPEGTTARQMGALLAQTLPGFDEQQFDTYAIPAEGYLFPDTYYFMPGVSVSDVIEVLRANYAEHTKNLSDELVRTGRSEREVITMASLLEGEGKTLEDKKLIAGILWKRLSIGMPLQVDAAFGYIYGKTGYVPTGADLKSNSAYNTYRYKTLPPTPINNPGDESITAALEPTTSDYLYYITGIDGNMYYAKTFAQHIENQKKYLQ